MVGLFPSTGKRSYTMFTKALALVKVYPYFNFILNGNPISDRYPNQKFFTTRSVNKIGYPSSFDYIFDLLLSFMH